MRIIVTLLKKDFANFFRDKTAVSLTFIVPVALIYIFGLVFGLNRKDSGPAGIKIAVVNLSDNPGGAKLVDALKAEKSFRVVTQRVEADKSTRALTEEDLRPMIRAGEFRFAVVIPRDLVADKGFGVRLKILSDPRNEIETQTVNGLLQKTIFSTVPQLLGQSLQGKAKQVLGDARFDKFNDGLATAVTDAFGGDKDETKAALAEGNFFPAAVGGSPAAGAKADAKVKSGGGDFLSKLVKIESEQVVGKQVKSPEATRVVGGWAMMFLMFAVSHSAAAFFDEKKAGLFQRLLSSPVTRSQILWSRFWYGVLLGLVQLTALFGAGRVLYGIDVLGNFGNLVLVCTAAAAACTAFGMLLAALAPTAQAANGLATFLVLTMSAVGGAWFPLSLMPEFMQTVGKFTLVYWAMDGFSRVLWAGQSLAEILPTLGVLVAISAGVMTIAIWRFKRGPIFD